MAVWIRCPADITDITGFINEPWHYRYVDVVAATEIRQQGICPEEYMKKINSLICPVKSGQ